LKKFKILNQRISAHQVNHLKKLIWISLLIIVLIASVSAVWVFRDNLFPSSKEGFSLVVLNDNTVLLSDSDVLSFNVTSQEIALTDVAVPRLKNVGDNLYSFSNVVAFRINGEEIYQGIFRSAEMSAIPELPKISILYPSDLQNDHAIRLFYPGFEPPSELSEMNSKFTQYFQDEGKLIH